MEKHKHIYISAGEASGDLLGANLARALLEKDPSLTLSGMGGERMKEAGVSIVFDSQRLSFVGIAEIITALPSILSTWRDIKHYLKKEKPDLVILIDLPETHLRIMKYAKKLGIKVLYYVSPQIWAWRYSRIKAIKKYADHMAVLFAFEEKMYRDAAIPVTFVGHPLSEMVKSTMTTEAAYAFFQLDPNRPVVSLFPGSRHSELRNHLDIMIDAVNLIAKKKPETQFVLALAPHFDAEKMKAMLPSHIRVTQNHLYDLLSVTNAAIAVSGTVTLEIALMRVPLCVTYRLDRFTAWVAKKLVRTKYIGLCNIVAEKCVAREFVLHNARSELIAEEIVRLLSDENYAETKRQALDLVKKSLDNKEASQKLTGVVFDLL